MTQYSNENSGTLFKNDRRETDKHPEYTGSINVDGTDYWLSAWIKVSKDGSKKFFSLSVKPKDAKPAAKPVKQASSGFDDMDSDVPF
jgi:hypothetical protein